METKEQWLPDPYEIAYYKKLAGDKSVGNDEYWETMLPLGLEMLNEQLCQTFTPDDLPASVKLYLAKATIFMTKDGNLKSRSMGTVSYSWDNDSLPSSVTSLIKKYNKCSGGRFVVFR